MRTKWSILRENCVFSSIFDYYTKKIAGILLVYMTHGRNLDCQFDVSEIFNHTTPTPAPAHRKVIRPVFIKGFINAQCRRHFYFPAAPEATWERPR